MSTQRQRFNFIATVQRIWKQCKWQKRLKQLQKSLNKSVMFIIVGCCMTLAIVGDTANTDSATAYNSIAANLLDVTLRVAKYKGGWDLQLKLAGLDKFSYQTQFTEFTGGNLMVQAINANAIDIASGSEIPTVFAIGSQAAVVVATTKQPTVGQVVLVPKTSTAKTIADLKGKKVGYIKATTAHYFLIRMLEEVSLTMQDINAIPLSIPDGLSAFRRGDLDAWATYGYSIPQAKKDGARILKSAKNILSGNFVIVAAPRAIADPGKKAAISDFLCRIKKSQVWRNTNVKEWSRNYAAAINVDESIVYQDEKEGLEQRRSQLLSVSNEAIVRICPKGFLQKPLPRIGDSRQQSGALLGHRTRSAIASQQKVADTFYKAGVISSKVNVKPLWDNTFTEAITKCK